MGAAVVVAVLLVPKVLAIAIAGWYILSLIRKRMKHCSKCKLWLDCRHFSKDYSRGNGIQYWCKSCRSEYARQYFAVPENKARRSERAKKYRTLPENKAKQYVYTTGCDYNDVLPWFLIPAGDRRCRFCDEYGVDLVLDHNHSTMAVRGWTHRDHNTAEGLILKSPNPLVFLDRMRDQLIKDGISKFHNQGEV